MSIHPAIPSSTDLVAVNEARVFFAHQSVGGNILHAIPRVYETRQLSVPRIRELFDAEPEDHLLHTRIGRNGDPLGKIAEFDSLIRHGIGESVDAAVLKLCYADVRADTDVRACFMAYLDTMTALQERYPETRVVVATVPLTTRRSARAKVRQWLGRGGRYGPEDNAAREEFNALLRRAYAGTGRLIDIASIESTGRNRELVIHRHRGRPYPALSADYASDHGHLNDAGGMAVACGMLAVLATALRD